MVYLQGGVGTVQHGLLTGWGRDCSAWPTGWGTVQGTGWGRDCSAWSTYRVRGVVGTVQHGLLTGWGRDCSAWSTYRVG